jgi:predicted transcriptional regulator
LSEGNQLSAVLTYGEVRVEFSGSPELVLKSIVEYLAKTIPNLDLARSITLNYGLSELIGMFKDYLKITPEGPRVIADERKFNDKEKIMLQLVASRIAYLSGKSQSDSMGTSEIKLATGLNPKTISSRLSELTKETLVERQGTETGAKYRITTVGISKLNEQLLRKVKDQATVSPVP